MPVCARATSPSAACSSFRMMFLHILADIAGLGQRGSHPQSRTAHRASSPACAPQSLAAARGSYQQDVRLLQLDIGAARPVHLHALVVVVDSDRQLLLRLILADHVLVEERLHFLRLGQVGRRGPGRGFRAVVFKNRVADGNALIADVSARVIARRRNQFGNGVLRLVTERTA
jgi:hypothetical protein